MSAEVGLGGSGAGGAHRRKTLAVARQHGVRGIETHDERAGEVRGTAGLGQAKEGPSPFAEALHEPSFDQQAQMARDARLRLAEDLP